MRGIRALILRFLGVCGLGRPDHDIADELETHRQLLADEYRRGGLGDDAARRAAAAEVGSLTTAAGLYRDRRGLPTLDSWLKDTAYAVRSLRRSPVLSLSMVMVLGLGIGFSTAVATIFYAIVWQRLPVPDPESVVKLSLVLDGKFSRQVLGGTSAFSYPELTTYRHASHTLESLAGVREERVTWQGASGPAPIAGALVSGGYFPALRVTPALGRLLTGADAREPVAVVGYAFWQESLGGRPDVIGSSLVLDRSSYVIVGVAEPRFTGTDIDSVSVWLPLEIAATLRGDADLLARANLSWLEVVGRLAPGSSVITATAEASVIARRLDLDYPGRRSTIGVVRASRLDAILQSHERAALVGAGAGVGCAVLILLLICGSNVAALLLARGATRQKEIAVRVALGAGRGRIVQQLAAEMAVIATGSAILGVAIAAGSLRMAAASLPPLRGVLTTLAPDAPMLGVAIAFAVTVACLFGLAPARQALRIDCLAAIKGDSGTEGAEMPATRVRRVLVSIQVAVSLVLLIGAALFARGVAWTLRFDPGYPKTGLYFVEHDIDFLPGRVRTDGHQRIVDELKNVLGSQPGIVVGLAMTAPFYGRGQSGVRVDDRPDLMRVDFGRADPGFFLALGVRPVAGRMFADAEPDAVVVNGRLARDLWKSEDAAIGQLLEIPGRGMTSGMRAVRVVGVIPTLQTVEIGEADAPTYYEPVTAADADARFIVVRAPDGVAIPRLVMATARKADPDAYVKVSSLADRIVARTGPARLGSSLAGVIGLLALIVAAVGIYGMVAHAVTCRTREIGVRMALGAARSDVLRLLVSSSLRGVAIGAVAALTVAAVVAASLSGPLRTLIFGLAPLDPIAWGSAVAVIAAITLTAAYLSARRALGIRPLDALRYDG